MGDFTAPTGNNIPHVSARLKDPNDRFNTFHVIGEFYRFFPVVFDLATQLSMKAI